MDKNKPQRYAVSMVWPNGIKTVNLFHHEANARQYVGQMLVMYKHNHVYLGEIQALQDVNLFPDKGEDDD